MLILGSLAALAADPSCPSGTEPVFRCVDSTRWALLCAGPDLEAPETLQYVEGRTGHPADHVFPQKPSFAPFGFAGSEGQSYAVRFTDAGLGYRLWAEVFLNGLVKGGVTTERDGKLVSEMSCMVELEQEGFFSRLKPDPLAAKPAPPPPPVPTACAPDQRDLLTCRIDTKTLSICATGAADSPPTGLQYRFGPAWKPEMITPATPGLAGLVFTQQQHAHGSTRTLGFPTADTVYRVWSFEPYGGCCGEVPAAGIEVVRQGTVLANLSCTSGLRGGFDGETLPWVEQR